MDPESIINSKSQRPKFRIAKYAPTKYDRSGAVETMQKKDERQKRVNVLNLLLQEKTDDLRIQANEQQINLLTYDKQKSKQMAREFYKKRTERKERPTALSLKFHASSLNYRLKLHNKYHKCLHGFGFNRIYKTDERYVVQCSHYPEDRVERTAVKCENCGKANTYKYMNGICKCIYYLCSRCKISTFHYEYTNVHGETHKMHQFYDKHSAMQRMITISPIYKRTEIPPVGFDSNKDIEILPELKFEDIIKENTKTQTDRKNFYRTLAGKPILSYARVSKPLNPSDSTHCEKVIESLSTLSIQPLETIKEEIPEYKTQSNMEYNPEIIINRKTKMSQSQRKKLLKNNIKFEESKPEMGFFDFGKKKSKKENEDSKSDSEEDKKEIKPTQKKSQRPKSSEGSTSSSPEVDKAKGIFARMAEKITEYKNKLVRKFSFAVVKNHPIYKDLISFFDTLKYILLVFKDYLDSSNLLLFLDLLKDVKKTPLAAITSTLRLGHLLYTMIDKEKKSQIEASNFLLHILDMARDDKNAATLIFTEDFGCFTNRIRHYLKEHKYVERIDNFYVFSNFEKVYKDLQEINLIKEFGIFSKMDVTKTAVKGIWCQKKMLAKKLKSMYEESDEEFDCPAWLSPLLESLPKSFGSGIKLVSEFCKILVPVVTVVRFGKDLVKGITAAIESFIEWLTGSYNDPKIWLQHKTFQIGNPINDLHIAFMAYRASLYTNTGVKSEVFRTQFYEKKVKAEEYATLHKQYSMFFTRQLEAYEKGMSEIGQPRDREFEPTVLALVGEAGSGKSTVWPVIVARALDLENEEDVIEAVSSTTYTWNMSSDYTTGIVGKRVIHYDDFGQDRTKNTDVLNLIAANTSAPLQTNSANITGSEIKGMTTDPDVLVICTNDSDFGTQQIYSKEAVIRRMDLILEIIGPNGEKKLSLEDPDAPQFLIVSCPRDTYVVGKVISLNTAVYMFSALDAYKKASFKRLKNKLNDAVKQTSFNLSKVCLSEKNLKFGTRDKTCSSAVLLENYSKRTNMTQKEIIEASALDDNFLDLGQKSSNLKWTKIGKHFVLKPEGEHVYPKANEIDDNDSIFKDMFGMDDILKKVKVKPNEDKKKLDKKEEKTMPIEQIKKLDLDEITTEQASDGVYENLIETLKASIGITSFVGASMFITTAWMDLTYFVFEDFSFSFAFLGRFIKKALVAVLLTTGICTATIFLAKYFFDVTDESGQTKTSKPTILKLSTTPSKEQHSIEEASNALQSLVVRATGTLVRPDGGMVNCLFIGDRYILTVNHIFQDGKSSNYMADGETIKITKSTWKNTTRTFEFNKKNLKFMNTFPNMVSGFDIREDVVIYQLDSAYFNAEKNIIKHFWDGKYSLTNFPVVKVDYYADEFYHKGQDEVVIESGIVLNDQIRTIRHKGVDVYYHVLAKANYNPRPASCGSAIMLTHTQEQPIVGVHAAVNNQNQSMFHFVTRQAILDAISESIDLEEKGFMTEVTQSYDLPEQSVLEYISDVKACHANDKTDLTHSAVYGCFGETLTEPAPLSYRDERLKLRKDYEHIRKNFTRILFSGYNQNPRFSREELEEAYQSVRDDNYQMRRKSLVPQRMLTLDEAINGLEFVPGNSRIEMTTSAGYPYSREGLRRKDLFYEKDDRLYPTERIIEDYNQALNNIMNGVVPMLPFTLTIKDERIKKSKIYDDLKPRLFANGNIISLLLERTFYYSHIMTHYHSDQSYSAIKLDRLSLDWHYFIMEMTEVGELGFDLDFKFWDRSISKLLLSMAAELALTPDANSKLTKLQKDTVIEWQSAPYYIYINKLYRALGTLASGKLGTYMFNCDINEILHRAAFLALTKANSPLLSSITSYKKHTRGKRGGDDTVQTVSHAIKDIYNGLTVAEWINARGMKATSVDKSDNIVPYKPVAELTFLKNTTGYLQGYYVPLSAIENLQESMNWVRLNKTNNNIIHETTVNVNAAFRAMFFYGSEIYDYYRNMIMAFNPDIKISTYKENKRIWSFFYYYPGSHSDYGTKSDQDLIGKTDAVKRYQDMPAQISNELVRMNYEITQEQSDTQVDVPGQVSINDPVSAMKPIMLCAGTGYIAEHKIKQFQDHVTDLVVMRKRYRKIHEITPIAVEAGTKNTLLITKDTLLEPIHGWLRQIFKLYRGSINLKIIPYISTDSENKSIIANDNTQFRFMVTNRENDLQDLAKLEQQQWYDGGAHFFRVNEPAMVSVPYMAPTFVTSYFEFNKDPFSTEKKSFLIETNNQNNFGISVSFEIFGCVGDDFSTGVFLGIPRELYQFPPEMIEETSKEQSGEEIPVFVIQGKTALKIYRLATDYQYPQKATYDKILEKIRLNKTLTPAQYDTACITIREKLRNKIELNAIEEGFSENRFLIDYISREEMKQQMEETKEEGGFDKNTAEINSHTVKTSVDEVLTTNNIETDVPDISNDIGKNRIKQVGATIQETEQVVKGTVTTAGKKSISTNLRAEGVCNDINWDLQRLVHKFLIVQQFLWTIDKTSNFTLFSINLVNDILTTPAMKTPFNVTALWKSASIKMRVLVRASPFYSGSLVVGFFPSMEDADLGSEISVARLLQLGGKILHVSDNQTIDYDIPFRHIYGFTEYPNDILGNFRVIVLNPLRTGATNDNNVLVTVYAAIDSSEFKIPEYVPSSQKSFKFERTIEQIGVMEFIEKAIDTTLPLIEDVAEMTKELDAHPITYQPPPVRQNQMGLNISMDNIQYFERMLVSNHNGMNLPDKQAYGATETETDMYHLMQNVKSLVSRVEWSTSAQAGSLLKAIRVGPCDLVDAGIDAAYDVLPPIDVFSQRFDYWNGSIRFIFDIAATQMHRGQLTVSYHPNLDLDNLPENITLATQQYFATFDLDQGRATVAMDIPYLQKKTFLPVLHPVKDSYPVKDHFNGVICIWIQNALRASTTVSNVVDVNIYKMAGPDFKVDVFGSSSFEVVKTQTNKQTNKTKNINIL